MSKNLTIPVADGGVFHLHPEYATPQDWAEFIFHWGVTKGWDKKGRGTQPDELLKLLNNHISDGVLTSSIHTLVNDILLHVKPPRSEGEWAALAHSEISEAFEEFRDGHKPNEIYDSLTRPTSEPGADEIVDVKPEGMAIEYADALIRIFYWFAFHKMDVNAALAQKMAYNMGRPYLHGGKQA